MYSLMLESFRLGYSPDRGFPITEEYWWPFRLGRFTGRVRRGQWWMESGQWLLPRRCEVCGKVRTGRQHKVYGWWLCTQCYKEVNHG